jgi:hypothetical protein
MKAVDIQKVRTAILSLQNSGAKESAQAVWDLLDNYISQRPQPITFRRGETGEGLKSWLTTLQASAEASRGASAASAFPKCRVTHWDSETPLCSRPAYGHMTNEDGISVSVCLTHGHYFDGRNGGEFVQTFFGDENSAADVAEHAARYAD